MEAKLDVWNIYCVPVTNTPPPTVGSRFTSASIPAKSSAGLRRNISVFSFRCPGGPWPSPLHFITTRCVIYLNGEKFAWRKSSLFTACPPLRDDNSLRGVQVYSVASHLPSARPSNRKLQRNVLTLSPQRFSLNSGGTPALGPEPATERGDVSVCGSGRLFSMRKGFV